MSQKGNVILVLLIAITLIFAGFGAYQYFKSLKPHQQVNTSPLPIVTPTATLLASPSATIDPTIGWKTYSGTYVSPGQSYSFKYPNTYYFVKESRGSDTITNTSQTDHKLVINQKLAEDNLAINTIEQIYTGVDTTDKSKLLQTLVSSSFGTWDKDYGYSIVAYDNVQVAGINSAKVIANNAINYVIPLSNSYISISFMPANTSKTDIIDAIINSLKVSN